MNKRLIIIMVIIFSLGWLSHTASIAPKPLLGNENIGGIIQLLAPNYSSQLQRVFYGSFTASPDKPSPKDRITEDQIKVTADKVIVDIKNVEWAKFTDTNSMDPVIDLGANALEVAPQSPDELQAGDIISYNSQYANGTIIHRIVEIGNDGEWYARVKGDNINVEDPGKVRFSQIQRVVIGIIY